MCRVWIRKNKAWIELRLARDIKNKKEGFYKYIAQKQEAKNSVLPLIKEKVEQVKTALEKVEVFNKSFSSVFTESQASHICLVPEITGRSRGNKIPPTESEDQVCKPHGETELKHGKLT